MTDPVEPTAAEPVLDPLTPEIIGDVLRKLRAEHAAEVPATAKTRINLMQRHRRIE